MKKLYNLLLLSILLPLTVYSQRAFVDAQMSDFMGQVNKYHQINPGISNIQGSPYLNDEFIEGEIYYDGKYRLPNVPLRINLFNGQIEFKNKNTVLAIANTDRIDKIVLDSSTFVYLENKRIGANKTLVKKWNPETPAILTKMEIEYRPKEEPRPFEDEKPDRFVRLTDKHYLMIDHNKIMQIKSVKSVIRELGEHEDELQTFARHEKISSGNPKEMAKLIYYYQLLPRSNDFK